MLKSLTLKEIVSITGAHCTVSEHKCTNKCRSSRASGLTKLMVAEKAMHGQILVWSSWDTWCVTIFKDILLCFTRTPLTYTQVPHIPTTFSKGRTREIKKPTFVWSVRPLSREMGGEEDSSHSVKAGRSSNSSQAPKREMQKRTRSPPKKQSPPPWEEGKRLDLTMMRVAWVSTQFFRLPLANGR